MCKKFVLASSLDKIESRFNLNQGSTAVVIEKSYMVSCNDKTYTITCEKLHELTLSRFGFTPFWARRSMNLVNARAEGDKNPNNDPNYTGPNSIFLKPEFRKPVQTQRCLVIADAWYDWVDQQKPYLFYLCNKDRPFAFAGIYDNWENPQTNENISSFAILTITANESLQKLGIVRMPVILNKSDEAKWIKQDQPLSYYLKRIRQIPDDKINGYPISPDVLNSGINCPELLKQIGSKIKEEKTSVFQPQKRNFHKTKPETTKSWFDNRKT